MSVVTLAIERPAYGSRCAATSIECARAAAITPGRRSSVDEPRPHHETTISPIRARSISRICASSTLGSRDEYAPRDG